MTPAGRARRRRRVGAWVAVWLLGAGMASSAATQTDAPPQTLAPAALDALKQRYRRPSAVPYPPDNPFSTAKAELGRRLFFDRRLSASGRLACASCHDPAFGWGSPPERLAGDDGVVPARKPPALLNLAWAEQLMWDGREPDLDRQILEPLTDPHIMGNRVDLLVERLRALPDYVEQFTAAFPDQGLTPVTLGQALGTFERGLVGPSTPFDRWVAGDESAIPAAAKRGFVLFNDLATRCADCHSGWRFTDDTFRDTGMTDGDLGRGALRPTVGYLQHAFKTPGLRAITRRAPYMHDGSLPDLDAVLDHYATPPVRRPSMPDYIRGFTLTPPDRAALKAFLVSLLEAVAGDPPR